MMGFMITVHHKGDSGATKQGKHMVRSKNVGMAKRKVLEDYKGIRVYAVSCLTIKRKTKTK